MSNWESVSRGSLKFARRSLARRVSLARARERLDKTYFVIDGDGAQKRSRVGRLRGILMTVSS